MTSADIRVTTLRLQFIRRCLLVGIPLLCASWTGWSSLRQPIASVADRTALVFDGGEALVLHLKLRGRGRSRDALVWVDVEYTLSPSGHQEDKFYAVSVDHPRHLRFEGKDGRDVPLSLDWIGDDRCSDCELRWSMDGRALHNDWSNADLPALAVGPQWLVNRAIGELLSGIVAGLVLSLWPCILALVATSPRIWIRTRPGACPICGYLIGQARSCSECGWTESDGHGDRRIIDDER
jgi:hypothetical protein